MTQDQTAATLLLRARATAFSNLSDTQSHGGFARGLGKGAVWAGGLREGQFATCGSWTGNTNPAPFARQRVVVPSVGEAVADGV